MKLALTPEESKFLVARQDDWLEVVPGNITFSRVEQGQGACPVSFFFESAGGNWNTKEWHSSFGSTVPNGPALLVLYHAKKWVYPFGVVSTVNRAWTCYAPFLLFEPYKGLGTFRSRKRRPWTLLIALASLLILFAVAPYARTYRPLEWIAEGIIGVWFIAPIILLWRGFVGRFTKYGETEDAARRLMFSLSNDIAHYQPEKAEPGKL